MKYILYSKTTGRIEQNISLTDNSKARMLEANSDLGMIAGELQDLDKWVINTDTLAIEDAPAVVINVQAHIRELRETYLKLSDWTVGVDSPLSDSKKAEWVTYRQALRDMPDTYSTETDVSNVTWPSKPS
jgi:hypothetical protein